MTASAGRTPGGRPRPGLGRGATTLLWAVIVLLAAGGLGNMLIPESLAYFWSTLALWLLARALLARTRSAVVLAGVAVVVAPLVRAQLGVLVAAALIAAAIMAATGPHGRELIGLWSSLVPREEVEKQVRIDIREVE